MVSRFDPELVPESPDLSLEIQLWQNQIRNVAGIDEAGRGALAGPVATAALILPSDPAILEKLDGVRDSKQLTPGQREYWAVRIKSEALAWGVGFASNLEIDRLGIGNATRLAGLRALDSIQARVEYLLLDYLFIPESPLPQTSLIKGDSRSLSIAGASVLAKTARDALMCDLDKRNPGYGFALHKGYCTRAHLEAIHMLGASPFHRLSFAPFRLIEESAFQLIVE
jgi:ribonuclease HII